MKFYEIIGQVRTLLQREGRVSYRVLKREFTLNDEDLEDLKAELIDAKRVAIDENGTVLVWVEATPVSSSELQVPSSAQLLTPNAQPLAERRQLTVMFCDLVGSTALSTQLDPEELREVIQAYRETCAAVIRRFEGYLAKYIGDGLLVYFGYPVAHEDDAARAVRTGLEIVEAIRERVSGDGGQGRRQPLQIRIGIHTGLVVAGEMGTADQPEPLAIVGETPNIAARLQEHAQPNSVVISPSAYRLVEGLFECQDLGPQLLKGLATPLSVYRVVGESAAQSRFEVAIRTGLTPLIGRAHEMEFLQERWEKAKRREGQVMLLSGEPGIGKSRLVQEFKEQLAPAGMTRIEFRCSPYHQNSAFYPLIDHLQRLLQFEREDSTAVELEKLQHTLSRYHFPQADTLPLLASLLSLPHPEGYPPITFSPQKQKEKTQAALVAWLIEEAERNTVFTIWEDVHWADPSTLEVLNLVVDQAPTVRLYMLLTSRPEFTPPWGNRSHLSQLTLSRLGRSEVETMVEQVIAQSLRPSTSSGRTEFGLSEEIPSVRAEPVEARTALSPEVVEQIVAKTDGVPLFVEELTKTVLESIESLGSAIPTTLHDSLMARLDRLGPAKEIAQLGAVLGREFSHEVLQAISPLDEETLQRGLKQLVTAELVYQRGLVSQAHYLFKHALIQDVAYQSLLKSTRQQYHTKIAQVLQEQFPAATEAQPELVAHHYTEAGLIEQAIPYWQQAGQRAVQCSAHVEAVAHLTKGLELIKILPATPERIRQELTLQTTLGTALSVTKGYAATEVKQAYARALELCRQVGETPQLFPVLLGLWRFYFLRAELQTARELAEQLLRLAQSIQDPALLVWPHTVLGLTLCHRGELTSAFTHLKQSIAFYDPQKHRPDHSSVSGQDPGVTCLSYAARILWYLGYPNQAREKMDEALTRAQELAHPFSSAFALNFAAALYQFLREVQSVQEWTGAAMTLSRTQGFPFWLAWGTIQQGYILAERGQSEEGIAQMGQGLTIMRATGAELNRAYGLGWLATAYGKVGQIEEGLTLLAEGLEIADKTEDRHYEAELYRLKGELLLTQEIKRQKAKGKSQKSENTDPRPLTPDPQGEAGACFLKAIEIAQKQQAKSLELRAVMSLSRLWQQQGKQKEAHQMLSAVYHWFTEGFDTKDLQEAKALLEELS